MAKKDNRRIEPTFDGPAEREDESGLSVSEDDRVVPSSRRNREVAPRRKAEKAERAERPEPKARRGRGKVKQRRGLFGGLGRLIYWAFVLAIWCGIAAAGVLIYYGAQMPSSTTWSIPDRPPNVKIVSVDGKLLANRGMTGGEAVGLHEMSPYIPQAVIAIEDRRFYSHLGVDPLGLARALVGNLTRGRVSQGGSTLTQQLAKNLFLKPDRTLERKVQEVLLALWLEHKHTKDQILEMYLNRVYFGSGAYGVEAASRRYFGKSARDVTLSEAALLAGLLKAPSRLSPARDPKAAEARAQLVLAAMRDEKMITDKELTTAMSAPATRAAAYWTGSEHYVADRVMEDLPGLIGEVRGDIIVDTTIDLTLQNLAEKSIRRLIDENGKKLDVSQGALVSIDNSGAVRAMVGGYDYANSQFDRAAEARRQPGSTFKPFVYLAAMEQGRTPDSIRNDAPIKIGNWTPNNYNGKYYGRVTLATALAKSLNSVAAQLAMEVGPEAVVEAARRMGIESPLQANASIALGTSEVTPLELTAAYVPFANGGYRPEIHFIQRVTTASGEVLYENTGGNAPRVIRPEIVGMMNAMMTGTVEVGTAKKAAFNWPSAGKTGTSQNSRDAWFVGYTSNLTTGVWFGNDDGKPMKKVTGGALPAQAWHEFMVAAHEGVPVAPLPGTWKPSPQDELTDPELAPSVPMAGDGIPAPQPEDQLLGEVARAIDAAEPDGGFVPMPREAPTSSVGRPVPQADVGGPVVRRQGSILDVILGN
ncbi:transglycosylase domain-containing protein [Mesorhizobium sp. KR1-2]|uniref:transglycosylase domain-containing protein n=1 Tax=Mesorhizobium sp. KR1-2 TaxID=3156609 RepID=UPI0032B5F6EF